MIGETVGNFEITSLLGRGGWGAVYLAQHKTIGTQVAIKVFEGDASANPTQVQRFFNEALAASKIPHSGVVRIFDVGIHTNGQAYLVMEYLAGETLGTRIKARTRLGIGMVADFGRQIASVLDATHNAGITHRDLKPENIYLVRDAELVNGERVKVLDFGIAKLQPQTTGSARMTSLSVANIGTPSYMSPEQWHSLADVDWRTDAYALGCVAFEMAVGRPPFVGESMSDVCAQHLTEPPPIASTLVPGLPPQLDMLIVKLLEKEPANRPTMREAMSVFTELGHNEGIALTTLRPGAMASPFAIGHQSMSGTAPAPIPTTPIPPQATTPEPAASQSIQQPAKPKKLGLLFLVLGLLLVGGVVGAAVGLRGNGDSKATDIDAAVGSPVSTTLDAAGAAFVIDAPQVAITPDAAVREVAVADAAVVAVASVDAAVVEVAADAGVVATVDAGAPVSGIKLREPPKPPPPHPPTPVIAEVLSPGSMGKEIDRIRPKVLACGKNEITGVVNITIRVDPTGRATAQVVNAPGMQGFLFCIDTAFNGARFPASQKGGTSTIGFRFKSTAAPTNSGGPDPPYGY